MTLLDGASVNDAPVLVAADVGIVMGGASTDVVLEVVDVVLMRDGLAAHPYAVAPSRASRRTIVQNLAVSLGVIALLVPSALLGFHGRTADPVIVDLHLEVPTVRGLREGAPGRMTFELVAVEEPQELPGLLEAVRDLVHASALVAVTERAI